MAASKFLIDTYDYHLRQINLAGFRYMLLPEFQAMFHFYTPPPHFLMFSGGIEVEHSLKMG